MRFRRFLATVALAIGLTPAAQAQSAQNGTTFGDWQLVCQAAGVNQTICAITQRLTITETGAFLAEIRLQLLSTDDGIRTLMAINTPTGMALPIKPGYRVGDAPDTLPLDWRTCTNQICTASRVLEENEVRALKSGSRMIIGYQPVGQAEPTAFPVSLRGVTAGLGALEG